MSEPGSAVEGWEEESRRALDELFTQTKRYSRPENFMALFHFILKFKRYSPFNAMLVHIQRPGAQYVLPARTWQERYERTIRADAQPLVILQPMGPVMFVFDVSETEGEPLLHEITEPFAVRSGWVAQQLECTISNCARDGIRVLKVAHGSQRAGSIQKSNAPRSAVLEFRNREMPVRYDMLINENLGRESHYATLAHELGHLYCGHIGSPNPHWWPNRWKISKRSAEFEAEAVAFLVCGRLGIDCASDAYLRGYLEENNEVPPISLDRVLAAAGLIEQMGKRLLPARKIQSN